MGETSATELDELQENLSRMLQKRRDLATLDEAVQLANQHLGGNERLLPVEQLEIYREQFWLRHTHALVEDFPGVGAILGQAEWERLSEDYLSAHPPTSFTLRDLGEKLPDFVAMRSFPANHALVCDMARLEWAYVELFDAHDPPPLAPEELLRHGEEALARARLRLSPGVRLLQVRYPVVDLRKRILQHPDQHISLPAEDPSHLVAYRAGLSIAHQHLSLEAFTLLDELARGESLERACESACALGADATANVAAHIGEWLASWVQLKWIIGVEAGN